MLYVVILWRMLKCFISGCQGNITSDCRQLAPQPQTIATGQADAQESRGSAGLTAKPHHGAGRARPPSPRRLEQARPRHICDALRVRKPASSESSAAPTREGLQGNRDWINSIWKQQGRHAEDCSHHVPHGWKATERPRPTPTAQLLAANKRGHRPTEMLSNPGEISSLRHL